MPSASFKNLRDEYDPMHGNRRRGWRKRPMKPGRIRVRADLQNVSDDALIEMVDRSLMRDEGEVGEAIAALGSAIPVAQYVAKRLLKGRRAEDHFVANSRAIADVDPADLIDMRLSAGGYDFGIHRLPARATEVKGLQHRQGNIRFTDREWAEAKSRRAEYWLILVANLAHSPIAQIFRDPCEAIPAKCRYESCVTASWDAHVSL